MPYSVDANQSEIIQDLKDAYCSVFDLAAVGGGLSDILVGHNNKNYLFEIKTETGKKTPAQEEFFETWRGQKLVVYSSKDALVCMGIEEGFWAVKVREEFLCDTSNRVFIFDTPEDAERAVEFLGLEHVQIRVYEGLAKMIAWGDR